MSVDRIRNWLNEGRILLGDFFSERVQRGGVSSCQPFL
jgi:hypothetical protein